MALAAAAVLLAGCSGGPDPAPEAEVSATEAEACAALAADLPGTLAGHDLDGTDGRTTTWGPVSLTCGVEEPVSLEPTSECDEVRGVGWFIDPLALPDPDLDVVVTAVGVRPRVAVAFPADERGQGSLEALSALADPVKEHLEVVQPCV